MGNDYSDYQDYTSGHYESQTEKEWDEDDKLAEPKDYREIRHYGEEEEKETDY